MIIHTMRFCLISCCLILFCSDSTAWATGEKKLVVGCKAFTESVILGEITRLTLAHHGLEVSRRELAGTELLWKALLAGEVDVYPEYVGTIREQILGSRRDADDQAWRAEIAALGVRATPRLGFNNTYVLGMKEHQAELLRITAIRDLQNHPRLKFGFSDEFLHRRDGWPGLKRLYHLSQEPRGIDHDVAYRALDSGELDVVDLFSTDAEIAYYRLRPLIDDLHYFPDYDCVLVYRADLDDRAPAAVPALQKLAGQFDETVMRKLNARVKIEQESESVVAAEFCRERLGFSAAVAPELVFHRIARRLREHLQLVVLSLLAAIAVSIPLGILAAKIPAVGSLVLNTVGVVQTIPPLVLLVLMVPLLGIGAPPAIAAMFLYSLLPIVRNTCAGLQGISPSLQESAAVLGLPPGARLRLIELPLAARSILAGIKTSAVINVGAATLAALIGAGGLGQPIITGIRLDSISLILEGAVPAALLAIAVQGLFDWIERRFFR
ncbi:MAG: glycine betaine ABC transporter substrate-binding protein [Planctomycetaceae bacterium]